MTARRASSWLAPWAAALMMAAVAGCPEKKSEVRTRDATKNSAPFADAEMPASPSRSDAKSAEGKKDEAKSESSRDLRPAAPPAAEPAVELAAAAINNSRVPADPKPIEKPKAPTVWHRDRQRPVLARVYVGDGNALELVSLNVTVQIEGPRARTVVDHVFRNPYGRVLEGTFEYPLPTGASAAYFAMFLGNGREALPPRFAGNGGAPPAADDLARLTPQELVRKVRTEDWGRLQEGRVVSKEKALEAYEEIVRGRIDPALLEYAGGNTFSGRVFPIPARGYNRVILAYDEPLPFTGAGVTHRFPLPEGPVTELNFELRADTADLAEHAFLPNDAAKLEGGGRVTYSKRWEGKGPGGEAVFRYAPKKPGVQIISGRQDGSGPTYLYARVRPDLKVEQSAPFSKDAVFLVDTSLSERPDRFNISMKLMKEILARDSGIERFNVLTFDVGARWLLPGNWFTNDAAGRESALGALDGLVLEGATDFSAALEALAEPGIPVAEGNPVNVFVLSDGQITWGEPDAGPVVARFESRCKFPTRFHCYRIGLSAENLELFEALTRKGGGVFQCYGESDLPAAAQAHRNQCWLVDSVKFVAGPAVSDVLVAGRRQAVYPGGELVLAARAAAPGKSTLLIEGTFLGRKYAMEQEVEITGAGELAPRGFGELAVAGLLALNDPALEPLAVAYCQQFSIGSKVASFLVLENDNDYKRLNLQVERGRTVPGDLGEFFDKVWRALGRLVTPRQAFERFLERSQVRERLMAGGAAEHVNRLLAVMRDVDFELPAPGLDGKPIRAKDLPPQYRSALDSDRRNVDAFTNEAARRAAAGDPAGAARALSGIIEEMPGRSDALRLVGYRLLALNLPAPAVRLFRQVQSARPFEPHSYRDLARSLEDAGRFSWAALQYEIVLAGQWHERFRGAIQGVAREEYVRMMRQALRGGTLDKPIANEFGRRLEQLDSGATEDDLRVTISWNTDGTDIDLWVIEPDGTKCFYQHQHTRNGGELSSDMTEGYGPERYRIHKAKPGAYRVIAHYYRANRNLLAGETHVGVSVARFADTPNEKVDRYNVVLKRHDQAQDVCTVTFDAGGKADVVPAAGLAAPGRESAMAQFETFASGIGGALGYWFGTTAAVAVGLIVLVLVAVPIGMRMMRRALLPAAAPPPARTLEHRPPEGK